MGRPEVLAPAGDMEKLRFAVAYGADAVYLAGKAFGMRTASDNFTAEEMAEAVQYCHQRGVKVYVTVNTLPRDDEMARLPDYLSALDEMGADALILADLGVLTLAKRHAPHCQIHISTQTSIVNAAAAAAYHELGASRVVLARELTLAQIAHIRENTPRTLELEAFVHGAMCMAYSGRCMLSNYLAGRDANRLSTLPLELPGGGGIPSRGIYAHRGRQSRHLYFQFQGHEYAALCGPAGPGRH